MKWRNCKDATEGRITCSGRCGGDGPLSLLYLELAIGVGGEHVLDMEVVASLIRRRLGVQCVRLPALCSTVWDPNRAHEGRDPNHPHKETGPEHEIMFRTLEPLIVGAKYAEIRAFA